MKHILALLCCCGALCVAAQTSFTYKGKQVTPDARTYLVRPDAKAGTPYVFSSLREALLAATDEATIYIAPSVYWVDDPDDPAVRRPDKQGGGPFGMRLKIAHLRLIGLTDHPEEVIIASNRGQTMGSAGNFTMFYFDSQTIEAENLTFGNYCNVDLVYPKNPKLNRAKRASAIVQAQLIICNRSEVQARNCRFISRLNLCPFAGARRAVFDDCYFECTDDALCGTGVYRHCRFTFFSSKPFYNTQGAGALFIDCDIHSLVSGRQYLTKVGSPVTMLNCRWTSDDPNLYLGWTADPTDDLRCYEHNTTLNGRPVRISADRPHLTVEIADHPLLLDTIRKGYPVRLPLSQRRAEIETGKPHLLLQSGQNVRWSVWPQHEDTCVFLMQTPQDECLVLGRNNSEQPCTVSVVATDTLLGTQAACVVTVHPPTLDAPRFVRRPTLRQTGDTLRLDYELNLKGRPDQSLITWYRLREGQPQERAIAVSVSRLHRPERSYLLTKEDAGYLLMAKIEPRHNRSLTGSAQTVTIHPTLSPELLASTPPLITDFRTFPTDYQPRLLPGFWTVDAFKPADTAEYHWEAEPTQSWYYGRGLDGAAHAMGLMQAKKGARLLYTPVSDDCQAMRITLQVDPCKSAGQGFGSATGQYMDIYIKMDTRTLTGYGLRIIRTTKYANAVDFQLMHYVNGRSTPLSAPVSATCYRSECTITLAIEGNRFTAHAQTSGAQPTVLEKGLVPSVDLAADITPNSFGGLGVQHTGSTGSSATLLRTLSVVWE
ncbi:MAG: hypothetical protein LBM06_02640 [Prevotellaceae bacterium]|jgi:hypothetical protein|nr:hypothetical protein [Prevotellaceae bacterium]